jgi:hypothetical protein
LQDQQLTFTVNPLSELVSTRYRGTPTASPTRLATLQDDPDLTPKARKPSHRTASTGAFLKSELHRRSSEANNYLPPTIPNSCRPLDEISLSRLNAFGQKIDRYSPDVPERRPSKSKSFLYKALGVRSSQENTSSIRRVESMYDTSKGTLLRHFSRVGRSSTSSSIYTDSNVSAEPEQSLDSGHGM